MSKRNSKKVTFERLNKLASDLEKTVDERPVEFGDIVGRELEYEPERRTFEDTLKRIVSKLNEQRDIAYKEKMDLVLAPLLEKANGDVNVLSQLITGIVENETLNPDEKVENPMQDSLNFDSVNE
ncbi:hypothetical protein [Kurthia sibirica]|uniref:Uncharacterized protein n=1 Tax=Kurthia sibirica TaxID=202750 RepID=A0A2U3AKH6_9BACL|nr:hypothetical protein [Kurthia sibirica]PWI25022.1 hypothetical protein DEX24_10640 [Kurthia sibirica]GEK33071.1 hypothetical protein KSI01_06040 [Kurthia sibirica]